MSVLINVIFKPSYFLIKNLKKKKKTLKKKIRLNVIFKPFYFLTQTFNFLAFAKIFWTKKGFICHFLKEKIK